MLICRSVSVTFAIIRGRRRRKTFYAISMLHETMTLSQGYFHLLYIRTGTQFWEFLTPGPSSLYWQIFVFLTSWVKS